MTEAGATTRERILDAALVIAARKGSSGTSMRALATACDVNVAALYYHFPSKADLLRAVIEERHYDLLMGLVAVPPPETGTDRERLRELIGILWEGTQSEEDVWRLLLAEGCFRNPVAEEVGSMVVDRFDTAVRSWLAEFDLAVPVTVAAGLVVDFFFSNMARSAIDAVTDADVEARSEQLAALLTGDHA